MRPSPELVSRAVQASWGLLTGTMLYSIAIGGLFSLAFAFAWGRMGQPQRARAAAALIALDASIITIYIVPNLKYPANPPSVGNPETIGIRTGLYFGMSRHLDRGDGRGHQSRAAACAGTPHGPLACRDDRGSGLSGAVVIVANVVLPNIDEVPTVFPASLLWHFRLACRWACS